MEKEGFIKYLHYDEEKCSGMVITSVGHQKLVPGNPYPKEKHPEKYIYNKASGRILDEYQVLYLSKGEGSFYSKSANGGREIRLRRGMVFVLFPGEWHNYFKEEESEWSEYWIGFKGKHFDDIIKASGITKEKPVLNVGVQNQIEDLYNEAYLLAVSEEPDYERAIWGIITHIIALAKYNGLNNRLPKKSDIFEKVQQAKFLITEKLDTITPEELANATAMGYSNFRKVFKKYTGLAPGQYILQRRIAKAKGLLCNTDRPIKEIAIETGFDNLNYFSTIFKEKTGHKPSDYRE